MRIVIVAVVGVLLVSLAFVFLLFMVAVTGLPLCSEYAPEARECLAATSAERIAGIAAGWAVVAGSALALAIGIRWAITRRGGAPFAIAALAAPLLALATIFLIPVEF